MPTVFTKARLDLVPADISFSALVSKVCPCPLREWLSWCCHACATYMRTKSKTAHSCAAAKNDSCRVDMLGCRWHPRRSTACMCLPLMAELKGATATLAQQVEHPTFCRGRDKTGSLLAFLVVESFRTAMAFAGMAASLRPSCPFLKHWLTPYCLGVHLSIVSLSPSTPQLPYANPFTASGQSSSLGHSLCPLSLSAVHCMMSGWPGTHTTHQRAEANQILWAVERG